MCRELIYYENASSYIANKATIRLQAEHYLLRPLQVGTLQVASTGIVALSYVQKVSEKVRHFYYVHELFACYFNQVLICKYTEVQVSLATDFMYNHMSRDVTSSVGYDYILRQVSVPYNTFEYLTFDIM